MTDLAKRIAQFENMAQADPTNEMAHFSLGRAYGEAGRWADAARSYLRCVQLLPDMSKAYQMAGEAFAKAGDADQAASILTRGYLVAVDRGDLMPRNAMANLLRELGRSIPDTPGAENNAAVTLTTPGSAKPTPHGGPVPDGMIVCSVTGKLGSKMTRPPFRGPVGAWIAQNIASETFFKGWVPQGTKVINELRLDLSRDTDQATYDQHMREYLGIDDALLARLTADQPTP